MKKLEKAFAISVLSGICCFSTQATEEAKAIFNKKPKLPSTSIPGVRSSKIMGTGPSGFTIREIKGVLQDGNNEIAERNTLLASIKREIGFSRTGVELKNLFTQKSWELLQYEPDKYKRDFVKRVRSHTHIDSKNDIQAKVNINLGNGELENIVVKTGGKRHFINVKTGDYDVTDIAPKTQTSSTDKSGEEVGTSIQPKPSDSKIKDARPKTQVSSTSKSEGNGKNVNKKTYSPQVGSQKLIDDVYRTKGLNTELLSKAIKDYTGEVEETKLESFYRFSGNDSNHMRVSVLNDGKISQVEIKNKGSKFEKVYEEDFWSKNLEPSISSESKYQPQVGSQKLIDDVHETKGLNKVLLYEAVKEYSGDVEIDKLEDVYRFLGNNNNSLEMYMDKHGKITGIFVRNGNEIFEKYYGDEGLDTLTFYKNGYFEAPGSKFVIEKPIYKGIDERGDIYYVVEENDGTFTKVLEKGGNMFVNVLGSRDASLYSKIKEQKIIEAKNKYGENKRVILESILVNGENKTVAYQLDDGFWRNVIVSDNGVLWLGDVIKYENLLAGVAGKLRKLAKIYVRFGAPLVGGATGVSKLISGVMK